VDTAVGKKEYSSNDGVKYYFFAELFPKWINATFFLSVRCHSFASIKKEEISLQLSLIYLPVFPGGKKKYQ
jgi:hypothetical protein